MLLENGVKIAHSRKIFKDGLNYARINESGEGTAKSWEAHTESLPLCDGRLLDELSTGGWYITQQGHTTHMNRRHACCTASLEKMPEGAVLEL